MASKNGVVLRVNGRRAVAGLLLLKVMLAVADAGAEETVEFYLGEARARDGGNLLYREEHTTRYVEGRIQDSRTVYRDPDGKEIATLISDYSRSLAMPTYVFRDLLRGYEEGLRFRDGEYYIFNREMDGKEREKALGDPTNVYSCQGWHYYVVTHLEELERDEAFALRLVFPNRLRTYTFRIEKVAAVGDRMDVRVRYATWGVSWFVPQLHLVYDKRFRRLLDYRGVSNILDADGNLQEVHITYQYGQRGG